MSTRRRIKHDNDRRRLELETWSLLFAVRVSAKLSSVAHQHKMNSMLSEKRKEYERTLNELMEW